MIQNFGIFVLVNCKPWVVAANLDYSNLIVVDKKGNAFIIDIKTGSRSKWTNFNQPTLSFDNKKYSKRNEYTLQQAVYRELLKRQTGVETAIGLLPIERESDKETDQIISAKKPLAVGLAKEVIYEFDDEGKVKKKSLFYKFIHSLVEIHHLSIPQSYPSH